LDTSGIASDIVTLDTSDIALDIVRSDTSDIACHNVTMVTSSRHFHNVSLITSVATKRRKATLNDIHMLSMIVANANRLFQNGSSVMMDLDLFFQWIYKLYKSCIWNAPFLRSTIWN
jgi:hypothetical protein